MTTLKLRDDQITQLAGLLVGVASVDGDFDVFEAGEIGDILTEITPGDAIPLETSRLILDFDPDAFSEADAVTALELETQEEKDAVLSLLLRVAHADDVADGKENEYVVFIAELLGASFEEVDLDQVIEIVAPPPLPRQNN